MDHHAAFLEAIIATPDDDTPRLIYADWLEENGEPERAEFIRVQIALTKAPDCPLCRNGRYFQPFGDHQPENCLCEGAALRRRNKELFAAAGEHQVEWMGKAVHDLTVAGTEWASYLPWFRRGFVESVSCSCTDWLSNGPAIVCSAPIREVRLTNAQTNYLGRDSAFNAWTMIVIGEKFPWDVQGWYATEKELLADNNAAALAWARSQSTTARPPTPSAVSA